MEKTQRKMMQGLSEDGEPDLATMQSSTKVLTQA